MTRDRYAHLAEQAEKTVGSYAWRELLTSAVRRALVAERILFLATVQDDSVPDAVVRKLIDDGWDYLTTTFPL